MFLNILLLIVGFILLIKGADIFVDGASSTAQNFKVPKILIGLTIVAFGTSAPEFAVSMNALANNSTDMVLGNVIGSCILNVLLIIGLAAVIKPIKIHDNTVKKEIPLTLLISTLLVVLMLDTKLGNGSVNLITRSDALVILLFFSVFVYYLIALARQKREKNNDDLTPPFPLWKSLLFVGLGLLGIIYGSDLVVDNAKGIAQTIGLSERIISLTIIAFGTSLPELVTTIVSSKKGEQDLLLGNIIGSNIFNICVVLGIPVAIYGTITPSSFGVIDLIALLLSSSLLFIFSLTKKTMNRIEGIIMLILFAIYYVLVFVV
ncbi:MAG: calcium/sodium antiporter [Bacilli bacterium]|nr:calcium/sodium antiporter [Bacilli bacterium]